MGWVYRIPHTLYPLYGGGEGIYSPSPPAVGPPRQAVRYSRGGRRRAKSSRASACSFQNATAASCSAGPWVARPRDGPSEPLSWPGRPPRAPPGRAAPSGPGGPRRARPPGEGSRPAGWPPTRGARPRSSLRPAGPDLRAPRGAPVRSSSPSPPPARTRAGSRPTGRVGPLRTGVPRSGRGPVPRARGRPEVPGRSAYRGPEGAFAPRLTRRRRLLTRCGVRRSGGASRTGWCETGRRRHDAAAGPGPQIGAPPPYGGHGRRTAGRPDGARHEPTKEPEP